MEFVPYITEQLSYLAKQDACLAPIFEGVFAADELPHSPEKSLPRDYIVNTDESGKPGTHCWPFSLKISNVKCSIVTDYQ